MKRKIYFAAILASTIIFSSCVDFLEPLPNGTIPEEDLWNRPSYIEGFVGHAYTYIPKNYANNRGFYLDGATDDAVITNRLHAMNRFGIGTMGTDNDPFKDDIYVNSYNAIVSVNRFLEDNKGLNTRYSTDPVENDLRRKRLHGEAFALRAWYEWELLKYYGGVGAKSGELLGISIIKTAFQDVDKDVLATPRSSYLESMKQIQEDCDSAFNYLIDAHRDWLKEDANAIETGAILYGAMDKLSLKAMLSRMYLTYASPLFNPENDLERWKKAAQAAKEAIDLKLKVDEEYGFDRYAQVDWNNPNFPGIMATSQYVKDKSAETAFYPTSLKGGHNGAIGASQELVDAFPMANGYPITDERSGYDPQNPYEGRDARFYSTIFYNQSEARDTKNGLIHKFESWVYEDANEGKILGEDYAGNPKTSLTNYHIKKFLYKNYNPNVTSMTAAGPRSKFIYRWAHVVLDFAEAANEVVGPTTEIYGLTAKEAISWLRKRKTTDGTESSYATSDPYLDEVSIDKDKFREFIRNERRLETCFEGMRFFDLQRWSTEDDLSLLNAVVHRPEIVRNLAGGFEYSEGTAEKPYVVVATRKFTSPYIPLPYDEILRVDELEQNMGWKAWE